MTTLAPGDIARFEFEGQGKSCPVAPSPKPFLTLPTNCDEPLLSFYEAFSWEGDEDFGGTFTHDGQGNPQPLFGCGKLRALFSPGSTAQPTTKAAQSRTGLNFSVNVPDEGLTSVVGLAQPAIRDVALTLPVQMTVHPLAIRGLDACSEADFVNKSVQTTLGDGCPEASKSARLKSKALWSKSW
jgi:hypothetical protein